ncbi:MAG: aminodeoxychorismate synthase component I [Mangrovibacterium sp.]
MNFRLDETAKRQMNEWGGARKPFTFLIDFDAKRIEIYELEESLQQGLCWRTPKFSNFTPKPQTIDFTWHTKPVSFSQYEKAFKHAHAHILRGDSFLLNLTMPTAVESNLTLDAIAQRCTSPYLVHLKDEFVCFSPEIFVRINEQGRISSFPMKGTIDAAIENASELLKNNRKEMAEHHTIVDLIRNDLSLVASEVEVARFAYLDEIKSNRKHLLQMSSEITGRLPKDWHCQLGDIFEKLLPAGSITGAPKVKTVEIIKQAEGYERGFYTGVFGVFDGQSVDSCVLIRFIEQGEEGLVYKSGGGITHLSTAREEYEELINKVYVPFA